MKNHSLILSLALAIVPCMVHAGQSTSHLLFKQDATLVTFTTDGGSILERSEIVKALDTAGASMLSRLTIPYNATYQSVTLDGASVVGPNEGMRLVEKDQIQALPDPAAQGAPYYQGVKVMEVRFGAVPVGATVAVRFKLTSTKPWLAGAPSFVAASDRSNPVEALTYTIKAPSTLKLHVHTNALTGGHRQEDGNDVWTYTAARVPPLVNVASAAERLAKSPYIVVSSASPDRLAQGYAGRILAAERPSLELQHLADTIGGDSILPATLMRRDYDWIKAHVRLVKVPLAQSNLAPRFADDILNSGYGTAEDRVILLQALLKAKLIPSDVVAVPTLPIAVGGVPAVMPGLNDQLMLSVDGGKLPLDIGDPALALGQFDGDDRGKLGLRMSPEGMAQTFRVPAAQVIPGATVATSIFVQADGSMDGEATMSGYGDSAIAARKAAGGDSPMAFRRAVTHGAPAGALVSIDHMDDPSTPANAFTTRGRYTIGNQHPLTGAYVMAVPRIFTGVTPLDDFAKPGGRGLCQEASRMEDTSISWKEPVDVAPPKDVSVNLPDGMGSYKATYVYETGPQTLRVIRELTLGANPVTCSRVQQQEMAQLAEVVRQDLAGEIQVNQTAPVKAK